MFPQRMDLRFSWFEAQQVQYNAGHGNSGDAITARAHYVALS